ncbi:hypothetical protein AgCh_009479 [Apium graveolens]
MTGTQPEISSGSGVATRETRERSKRCNSREAEKEQRDSRDIESENREGRLTKAKEKALIIQSDSESSDSDDDDSEPENLSEVDVDAEMMQLCALMVKGITKIAYRKFRKGKKFSRIGGSSDKKGFRRTEGKGGKSDRGDNSNVKCYNYGERGHISPDCKKGKGDKGQALITKKKNWVDTSESEEEVNYALMANTDSSSDAAELKNDYLKNELEKEREIIRTWTNSGRTTQNILSSGNWREGLGYKDDKNEKGNFPIKPIAIKQTEKPKINPVKFVTKTVVSDSEEMKDSKTEVKEKSTSDKLKQDKPALVNIVLMTKKQLKYKLKEIKNVNKVKEARKNRNGKEGVNKSNNYMHVPKAPRKKCYNCGNSNHLAYFYRKNKDINSLPPRTGVKSHVNSDAKSDIKSDKKHVSINSETKSAANANKLNKAKGSKQGNRKNILVLDNGCSGHMTGNKALLSDFVEKAGPGVSYGDGNMGKTLGYGNINLGNVIIETVALV